MTTQVRKPRTDKTDERYSRSIQIAAPLDQWLAVRAAIAKAGEKCQDHRVGVVAPFLARLDKCLKDFKAPGLDSPGHGLFVNESLIPVEGRVANWVLIAEFILAFGDERAKAVGIVIIPACSQVVFATREADDAT